jgi:hypothetical protein
MSGKPGRCGRKSFVATPEQRNNVKILVGLGVPQAMICQLVVNPQTGKPLDEGTLKKHFPRADFQQSLGFSQKAIELDDQVNCTHKAPWAGADPAVVARDVVETAARVMGHLDRSWAVAEQGMAIALERGHLFSIVWASVSRILALTSFGCYAEAVACADHALAICVKHGFNTRIGNVLQHRGPALFELGEEEQGLSDIKEGVTRWRERNGVFFMARNLAKLGEYQLCRTPRRLRLSLSHGKI